MLIVKSIALCREAHVHPQVIVGNRMAHSESAATAAALTTAIGVFAMPADEMFFDLGAVVIYISVADLDFCYSAETGTPASLHCRLVQGNLMVLYDLDRCRSRFGLESACKSSDS